jgi:nucleoside-diphosphate-sugar epimerase
MKRVMVLGGTGWVGRHVCRTFAEHGYDVVVSARNYVAHVAPQRFRALDLATASTGRIAELLRSEQPDVVVNATASINATDGWDRTDAEHRLLNVTMVERLLAAVAAVPWPVRVVHLGTIHEYGPAPPGTAIAETQHGKPSSGYARSKLAGSEAVLRAAVESGIDGVVLRLVNLCGPHPSPEAFLGKVLRLLRDAGSTGTVALTVAPARRDYLDVRDAAEAVVAAAAAEPGPGGAFNIGSGHAVELRQLVLMLAAEAGVEPDRLDLQGGAVNSLGGEWTEADISLARGFLGWHPRIELRESLRDMWRSAVLAS